MQHDGDPDKQENAAKGPTPPLWRVISPKPGDHADPKADDFANIDGIARARKLSRDEQLVLAVLLACVTAKGLADTGGEGRG